MSDNCSPQPAGIILQSADAFKIAQAVYNVVTGKTEKLSQLYDKNFKIDRASLTQLHAKLSQMRGQWQIIESTDSVTVHHANDNKEQFSSFERFGIYDSTRTEPVESVVYQHNFLMAMPQADKPQPYAVTVRIVSRAATLNKLEIGMPSSGIFRIFQRGTIIVEIDYVDYVVARSILSTIDSWVAEVTILHESALMMKLQMHSHWIPRLIPHVIFIVAFVTILKLTASMDVGSSPKLIGQLILFALPFLWIVVQAAQIVGRLIERQVDNYAPLSYINLNIGDQRLAEKVGKKNTSLCRKALAWVGAIVIEGVGIGLFTSWLYDKIK